MPILPSVERLSGDSAPWRITWSPIPEVPAPSYADVFIFPPDGADPERHAEIDVIAAQIRETPETVCGHYVVSRFFGPVQYRAVAIPHDRDTGGE